MSEEQYHKVLEGVETLWKAIEKTEKPKDMLLFAIEQLLKKILHAE